MTSVLDWWVSLSGDAKDALLTDPRGPVPAQFVEEVIEAAGDDADALRTFVGPSGPFVLPDPYAKSVEQRQLLKAWNAAREARLNESHKHFRLASAAEPLVEPTAISQGADLKLLDSLRREEDEAERAYRASWDPDLS